jgi:hypothetical protein
MPAPRKLIALFLCLAASTTAYSQEEAAGELKLVTPDEAPPQPEVPIDQITDPSAVIPLPDGIPVQAEPGVLPAGPSQNATVNLIAALVKKGVLTQAEAVALIQQAELDAANAQAQAAAAMAPPLDPEGQRVTYIPEMVKRQMRDQIQQELMAQAREEQWGQNQAPDWTSRIIPFGDFRLRSESIFFNDGNNNLGEFTNFNAINTGAPFDASPTNPFFAPKHNVDQDRHRPRIRLRAGAEIMLGEGFSGGVRLATGESDSPVSPNQSLGGGGGNFSKYQIWLDRAFLAYDAGPGDGQELVFMGGRFDNPFLSSEVQFDDDLGFDGLAARAKVRMNDSVNFIGSIGAFPVFNTALNFASNNPSKFESDDKYLYGGQIGIDWKIDEDWSAKLAVGYYDYNNIEGRLSTPFVPLSSSDAGDTDATRPGFAQRGNTYFPIRNITPTAANNFGTTNQFQYYGLATPFRTLTVTGKVDYEGFDPIMISALAEVVKNVAYDQSALNANAVNNRGADPDGAGPLLGNYDGGDMAWYLGFKLGKPKLENWGDWVVNLGYRYVESDAVVDGLADSDFGGGGTNVKGIHLGTTFSLTPHVNAGLRWLSSDEIAGAPLKSDTLQIDLNAKF